MADSKVWTAAKRRLSIGKMLKDDTYQVIAHADTAIVLQRLNSGSKVRITKSKVEKTADLLANGATIPFRSVSYTVAEEFGIIAALGRTVVIDHENKTYKGK